MNTAVNQEMYLSLLVHDSNRLQCQGYVDVFPLLQQTEVSHSLVSA